MKPIKIFAIMIFWATMAIAEIGLNAETTSDRSNDRIELGRYLFYDTQLSYNNTKSCSSCHSPQFAFSDGYRRSIGADGYAVRRNAPSLINAKFLSAYTWADSSIHGFEAQLILPFFNNHPKELGWEKNEKVIVNRFLQSILYQQLFRKAFPTEKQPISIKNIFRSLLIFENQLVSFNARYDAFLKGNKQALSAQEKKGMKLFYAEKLGCGSCHFWQQNSTIKPLYANTGLYNINNKNEYPNEDEGLFLRTGNSADKGSFRVPSLRNVLLTAPYTHDGSVANIVDMIGIYERGGRKIEDGELAGDGKYHSNKNERIKGFTLSNEDRLALISFLGSFTDTSLLQRKNLMNPFN